MPDTATPTDSETRPAPLRAVKPPAKQAVLFICRRCERRAANGDAGSRLARRVRKLSRAQFGKRAVRTVFTSCMSICPRNALTVTLMPGRGGSRPSGMFIADADRPKAAARALMAMLETDGAR